MPNLSAFFEENVLCDLTLQAKTGEEISVHKSIIAASIPGIKRFLLRNPDAQKFPITGSFRVLQALVALSYDGPLPELAKSEISELAILAKTLEISDDLLPEILGVRLPDMILQKESEISQIDQNSFLAMVASEILDSRESEIVVEFARRFFGVENFCDLLKIGKRKKFPITPEFFVNGELMGNLNFASLAENSLIQIRSEFFDWTLRVEISDHLRVVYEDVHTDCALSEGLQKFPCALFEWVVDDVLDKEVFVCFPAETRLQWSTTWTYVPENLSLKISELSLNSLTLWYIATHLSELLPTEDVFNKLGNVEFRAVSAFVMLQTYGLKALDQSILSARDR